MSTAFVASTMTRGWPLYTRMLKMLATSPRTTTELAGEIGLQRNSAHLILCRMHRLGVIRVAEWVRPGIRSPYTSHDGFPNKRGF